jgi:glycosyltransferase involved in cell wall biosynthesis
VNIIYLGLKDFPVGLAKIQKVKLICKALINAGQSVRVINRSSSRMIISKKKSSIPVHNCVITPPDNGKAPPYYTLFSFMMETIAIHKYNKSQKVDYAIISTTKVLIAIFYRILSKILRIRIILVYMELCSAMDTRKRTLKYNDILFERYAFRLFDGVWPISDILKSVVEKNAKGIPTMKVPIIADFDYPNTLSGIKTETAMNQYFLFCGAIEYKEIIEFIIRSFERLSDKNVKLILVLNGGKKYFHMLEKEIQSKSSKNQITIVSKVPKEDLFRLYMGALGLLIPLRPTLQDKARFPHKIGEYLSSGSPILTTDIGEISNYFTHMENAYIAKNYSEQEYSELMHLVLNDPILAAQVGKKGTATGLQHFGYKSVGKKMVKFTNTI